MSSTLTSTQLQRLYRDAAQPDDLFPVFERTRSFQPWIVILAIIPTLYTFQQAKLSEIDSEWVLRSLDLLRSSNVEGIISPGGRDSAPEIRFQPPLGTWLSAISLHLLPGMSAYQAMTISWIGTSLLIAACYWIGRDLFGARPALWTVLLASGQSLILQQTQTVIPVSLSLVVGFLSIRAFENHLARERSVVTWQILGGGVALGVCLLLGGPVVLLMAAIQLLMCLFTIRADRRPERIPIDPISPRQRMLALVLLWATCFALGGWWPLMMSSAYGVEFWAGWFRGLSNSSGIAPLSLTDVIVQMGPIFGLACYGLGFSIWSAMRTRQRGDVHLVIWVACGLIFWRTSLFISGPDSLLSYASLLLVVISLVIAAAVAFNQVTLGRLSVIRATFVSLLAALFIVAQQGLFSAHQVSDWWTTWEGGIALLLAIYLIACFLPRIEISHRTWPRLFAAIFMLLIVVANYQSGRAEIRDESSLVSRDVTPEIERDQLLRLNRTLDDLPPEVEQIFIVTDRQHTSRFRLELVVHHPQLPVSVVSQWEEAFDRLTRAEHRPITAVFEWGSLGLRPRNRLSRDWKQRYLGRTQKLGDGELRLSVFFPIEK